MEGQRHLVFTLGKCKDGASGPPSEGVRCAFAFALQAALQSWVCRSSRVVAADVSDTDIWIFSAGRPSVLT